MLTRIPPFLSGSCPRKKRHRSATTVIDSPLSAGKWSFTRVMRERQSAPAERAQHLFRICLAREPSSSEVGRLNALHREMAALVARDAAGALKIAGLQDLPGEATTADTAAWVLVARTVLNLDEFVTRE